MRRIFGLLLLCLLPLAACTGPVPSERHQAILGGSIDPGDPAVVLIRFERASGGYAICSGTIVSPHVVLTAAHCLDPTIAGKPALVRVFLGSDLNTADADDPTRWVNVSSTQASPRFEILRTGIVTADVGVVITETALAIRPAALLRTPLDESLIGASLRLVGFGVTDDVARDNDGVRHQAEVEVTALEPDEIAIDGQERSSCEGDSGGPAFLSVNGEERLAAIISHGTTVSCVGTRYLARLDLALESFLDPIIASIDPAPVDMGSAAPADEGGCSSSSRPPSSSLAVTIALGLCALGLRRRRP